MTNVKESYPFTITITKIRDMKSLKVILLSSLIMSFTGILSTSSAQLPIDFGIKAGVNLANFSGTDMDLDSRQAFVVGASLDISLPMFPVAVESGVYYSQKGAESGGSTIKLDYVEVPVLAKFNFGPPGPFSPHLVAGPYVGFLVDSELEDSAGNTADLEDFTEEVDFGGIVGLGADFNMGLTKLNAQVRYSMGLSSVFTNQLDDGERNAVLSVVVGVRF